MNDDLTPEQDREYALGRLRSFAMMKGLSGDDIVLIFHAGMGAARYLRPEVLGKPAEGEAA